MNPPAAKSPAGIVGEGQRIGKPGEPGGETAQQFLTTSLALRMEGERKSIGGQSIADFVTISAGRIAFEMNGTVGWARTTDLLFHKQAL